MMLMNFFMSPAMTTHNALCFNYYENGDYDDDGDYVKATPEEFTCAVNVQEANEKDTQWLVNRGDAVVNERVYLVHINDGNQVYHEREVLDIYAEAVRLDASYIELTISGMPRVLRVVHAVNRPHRFFCKAYAIMESNSHEKN